MSAAPAPPSGQQDIAALLGRLRLLELAARRNAGGALAGDYLSAVRGGGMRFHEARKYVPGEPARTIDWNVTARLGEPYVKVHLEERQREVMIALDVSPSMHTGFQDRTKLELALELAATLAVSAVEGGDRLGWVLFADTVLSESRPRGGRVQLHRALRAFLEHTGPWTRPVAGTDPRLAIHALERRRRSRLVVFLISDFIDHDVPEDLRYLRPRHDVSLLHVYDPFEYLERVEAVFTAYAPEGPRRAGRHRGDTGGGLEAIERFLAEQGARYRLSVGSFSTAEPVAGALDAFFHRKRRLAVR